MRRLSNQQWLLYTILGLIVIGILYRVAKNPSGILIPVIVLGGVFLLYKFPPNRWRFLVRQASSWSDQRNNRRKRTKKAKFRVIPGSKKEDRDDFPKYH